MTQERFFIPTPTPTDRLAENSEGKLFPVYLDASSLDMKWSGKMSLPASGTRVYMHINSIGWGRVEGYAESHGWLGLLVKPEAPPEWWSKQRERNRKEHARALKIGAEKAAIERIRTLPNWILEGICCVFGAEISLDGPKPSTPSVKELYAEIEPLSDKAQRVLRRSAQKRLDATQEHSQ